MIRRMFKTLGKARSALFLFVQLVRNVGTVGVALLLSSLIDTLSFSIETKDATPVMVCAAVACIYAVVFGMVILASEYLKAAYVRRIMVSLREGAAAGILAQTAYNGEKQNSAEAQTLLGQGMDTLETSWIKTTMEVVDACMQAFLACVLLVLINHLVAIVSVIAMALPTLIPKAFSHRLTAQQKAIVTATTGYNARVRDMLQGLEVIHSYHIEPAEQTLQNEAAGTLEDEKKRLSHSMGQMLGITNAVSISAQFLIMALPGWFAVEGLITLGSIVAVTQLSGQVISGATQLSGKFGQLKAAEPLLQQVDALSAHIVRSDKTASTVPLRSTLELEQIDFSYAGAPAPVIHGLSARFERGKKYALVGESGCGKSTLLALLGGNLQPTGGKMLVDGAEGIPDAACIHQNVFLFDDTLRNNLTLWGTFSDDEIENALARAGLAEKVASLPQGLNTPVGENGSHFSGGERQRIAIARALLHKKDLLLVDEAPSALDPHMAALVEDSLLSLNGVTVIEVTHHLDPARAKRYDEIIEMKDGNVREIA